MNTFKHSGGYGDMILGLPTVIAVGGGIFYLHNAQTGAMQRLFELQPYIKQVISLPMQEWKDLEVTHNLDLFRTTRKPLVAHSHLAAFNVEFDLSQQWLFNVVPKTIAKVIIHDTCGQRYPGCTVNWNVLRGYEKDCIFIGFDSDYAMFREEKHIDILHYKTEDFYEVAQVIAGANLFIGNQSAPYTIAEGLKKNLVIDLHVDCPQYPFGKNGYVGASKEEFIRLSGVERK
jgi:hypothetical protein